MVELILACETTCLHLDDDKEVMYRTFFSWTVRDSSGDITKKKALTEIECLMLYPMPIIIISANGAQGSCLGLCGASKRWAWLMSQLPSP